MWANTSAAVSVVIPCYRCGGTVGRALASIAAQTVRPREVVVVDDGSDDETPEVLQSLQSAYPKDWLRVIRLRENCGPGAARNVGWDACTQPYVAFLDADDAWHPQKIEIQTEIMARDPSLVLSGHGWLWVHGPVAVEAPLRSPLQTTRLTPHRLLVSNILATPTVMVRRDIPLRFDARKRYSEDYLLWLEILFSGYSGVFIHANLAYLYKAPYGAGGLSGQLWQMELGELDTYYQLWGKKRISTGVFLTVAFFSLLKFGRRMIWNLVRNFRDLALQAS